MSNLRKQRTFSVNGEEIKIVSVFSRKAVGYYVTINGEKFFNNGVNEENFKSTNLENWREVAEDRCFKKWLDKKNSKKVIEVDHIQEILEVFFNNREFIEELALHDISLDAKSMSEYEAGTIVKPLYREGVSLKLNDQTFHILIKEK